MMSPPRDSIPRAALEQCLRELPNCVVLRNEQDLFGRLQRGGDVDLLVGDLELAERTLIRHLGCPIRITRRSYVREYFYDWGNVDLLPTIEWRGARYLRTEAVVDGRQLSERGRPVPRVTHEALISWLTSLLWGGFFKERYAAVIRNAVENDGGAFRRALMQVAGKTWGVRLWRAAADGHPEISSTWAQSLRRAIWWRACVKSPVRTVERYLTFVTAELRLRLAPPVPWVAVLDSDGSKNFSVIDEMIHRFAACPYAKVEAFHRRPPLVARASVNEPDPDNEPHGNLRRGPIGFVLSLFGLTADWLVGYWTRLVHLRAKGYILAFDWTYFDLVVEHKYYRYRVGPRLARTLWWLLPKPDLVFLLDSEPDVPRSRQQDVPLSELARQRDAHRSLVRQLPGAHIMNGSLPPSVLAHEVQRVIRAWMLDRSAASLGTVQAESIAAHAISGEGSHGAPNVVEPR